MFHSPRTLAQRSPRFRILLLLCLAGMFVFALLACGIIFSERLVHLDATLADRLHAHALESPRWVAFFRAITALGTLPWFIGLSLVAMAIMIGIGKKQHILPWMIVLLGSGLLVDQLKKTFDRERPPYNHVLAYESSFSFPSGHAVGSAVAYGLLAYFLACRSRVAAWRRFLALGLAALVLLIGFSRLYLGVHYLSDVVAGYALACGWLGFCLIVIESWGPTRSAKPLTEPTSR